MTESMLVQQFNRKNLIRQVQRLLENVDLNEIDVAYYFTDIRAYILGTLAYKANDTQMEQLITDEEMGMLKIILMPFNIHHVVQSLGDELDVEHVVGAIQDSLKGNVLEYQDVIA